MAPILDRVRSMRADCLSPGYREFDTTVRNRPGAPDPPTVEDMRRERALHSLCTSISGSDNRASIRADVPFGSGGSPLRLILKCRLPRSDHRLVLVGC